MKLRQKIALSLLPSLILFGGAEAAARIVFWRMTGKASYLIAPFGSGKQVTDQSAYPVSGRQKEFTYLNDCTGEQVVWTLNSLGARGGEWSLQKRPGTLRIVALGGSTTLGMKNPDWATYPLFLQQALEREGHGPVEVFNAGWPGHRLSDVTHFYKTQLAAFHPDIVIFYEGWNDTSKTHLSQDVVYDIFRVHRDSGLGRAAHLLYYRSMLYTYLIEKIQFSRAKVHRARLTPRIELFHSELEGLISLIRESGAVPVLVLQMNHSRSAAGTRTLNLQDAQEVRRFIVQKAWEDRRLQFNHSLRFRFYQSQVMDEVVRRTGEAQGVQVIDPWPTFDAYSESELLFCGPIHLTDLGNKLLAETIAEQLKLPSS